MTAMWAKYRGPGDVKFSAPSAKLSGRKRTTTATFSQPGEYILQAVVDDGSGESAGNFGYHCCWTNAQLTVTIAGSHSALRSSTRSGRPESVERAPQSSMAPLTFAKDVA